MPTHAEQRVLPYSPEQLYRLVADVERYPEFLPWAVACRIRKRDGNVLWADLVIGFKMIRERFTSKVTLDEPGRAIHVEYVEGPFHYLNNHWTFHPHPEGCLVDFYVDFEFRNKVLQKIIGALFNEAVRRMVAAFEGRAHQLYGRGAVPGGAARPV
ncbi:type II toxin-antitoxin system RatA family toxin [Aerophototrophica crusticola]|uniref:Type II toxin-antitoxin system RatA family toxin n=1 Tax=Aerophototrophica crusticola TaxID=1709002 RepID=A0A858R686_9PROT|nr:type II toxin-antitoxin system RatA family toxin [Rhodospirillaceae bacterium B3]